MSWKQQKLNVTIERVRENQVNNKEVDGENNNNRVRNERKRKDITKEHEREKVEFIVLDESIA